MLGWVIPNEPIIVTIAIFITSATEDEAFFEDDGDPDSNKVAHKSEEVGEDVSEMASASKGTDGVNHNAKGVPYCARHLLGIPAERLEVDPCGVGRCNRVGNEAEGDYDGAKVAKSVERAEALDYKCALPIIVGRCVLRMNVYAGSEADTAKEGEGERDKEAENGKGEEFEFRCAHWIVDEEIGR